MVATNTPRSLGGVGSWRHERSNVTEHQAATAKTRYDGGLGCSACPPNSLRMAERTLSAKSASPRELKRS